MPTYDYTCRKCGHTFEVFEGISAKPKKPCPKCKKGTAHRMIGAGAGLLFKGSGFYITDYRGGDYASKAGAEKPAAKTEGEKASPKVDAEKAAPKADAAKAPAKAETGAGGKAAKSDAGAPTKAKKGTKTER